MYVEVGKAFFAGRRGHRTSLGRVSDKLTFRRTRSVPHPDGDGQRRRSSARLPPVTALSELRSALSQGFHREREIRGISALVLDVLPRLRMGEAEFLGVQPLPCEP